MPATWQATGQLEFLEARVDEFKAAQRTKKGMKKFFKRVNTDFHDIWEEQRDEEYEPPKPLLTKKGKLSKRARQPQPRQVKIFDTKEDWMRDRERKIRSWFYNRTSAGRRGRARVNFKIGFGNAGNPRVLSEENLYSKRYYASRVKAKVDNELLDVDDSAMRIATTRRILREAWKGESSETKKEIKELRKQLIKEKREEEEEIQRLLGEEQIPDSLDPEELLLMQQALPEIMVKTLNMIATLTGWSASVILGGPDMRKTNGDLTVRTYHVGAGKGGVTWKGHVPSIDDEWGKPFREYLRIVYPERERLRRAVQIDEGLVKNPQSMDDAGRAPGRLNFVDAPDTPDEIAARELRLAAEKKADETATAPSGVGANDHTDEGGAAGGEGVGGISGDHNDQGVGDNGEADEEDKDGDGTGDSSDGGEEKLTMPEILYTLENGVAVPLLNDKGDVEQVFNALNLETGDSDKLYQFEDLPLASGVGVDDLALFDPNLINFGDPNDHTGGGDSDRYEGGYSGEYLLPPPPGESTGAKLEMFRVEEGGAGVAGMPNGIFGVGAPNAEVTGLNGILEGSGFAGVIEMGGGAKPNGAAQMSIAVDGNGLPMSKPIGEGGAAGVEGALDLARGVSGGGAEVPGGGERGLMTGTPNGGQTKVASPGDRGSVDERKSDGATLKPSKEVETRHDMDEPDGEVRAPVRKQVSSGKGGKRKQPDEAGTDNKSKDVRGKRARVAPAVEVPDWIEDARKHLSGGVEDEKWESLVEMWFEFETKWAKQGRSQGGRLGSVNRPSEMAKWLPAPRDYSQVPEMVAVDVFAKEWICWWNGMQPKARQGEESKLPKPLLKEHNLGGLKKGGPLGIVLVVIALRWWAGHADLERQWEEGVEDLLAVFRRFGDA